MSSRRFVMLALLFTFSIVLAVPAWAQNQDTQGTGQSIYGCTVISKPGPYFLAKNILATPSNMKSVGGGTPSCIVIVADFVSLDLRGYTITGPGYDQQAFYGIYVPTPPPARAPIAAQIRNGSVTKFDRAISIEGEHHTIEGVRVAESNAGILLNGDNIRVKDSVVWGNWLGIISGYGSGLTVEHCQVHQNSGTGIALGVYWDPNNTDSSLGSRIVGNSVSDNGEYGIFAQCPSLILQNMVYQNGWDNIKIEGSGCTLSDNNPENPAP